MAVDMTVTCHQDVKKLLWTQARIVKKWAVTHECDDLEEGVLGAARADEYRNVMRLRMLIGSEKNVRYWLVGHVQVQRL